MSPALAVATTDVPVPAGLALEFGPGTPRRKVVGCTGRVAGARAACSSTGGQGMDAEHGGTGEFTVMLEEHRAGDPGAEQRMLALVYSDLRRLAHRHLSGNVRSQTLDTTALINESYLRLVKPLAGKVDSRAHFMNLASRIMRQIIIDYARKRILDRDRFVRPADGLEAIEGSQSGDREARNFIALDEALNDLERIDERRVRVVECRFFGGLSEQETAEALGVSVRTVQREWAAARDWLAEHMDG